MGAEAGTDGKHAFPVMAAPSKQRRHMNEDTTVMEIKTGGQGVLRVWQSKENGWCWATPNGSEGSAEPSIEQAVAEAFAAEGLNPEDYGYSK
jgi:hypothetical protein